jgi:oxygen-independent coproporphyrinogen-3 oxidase
MKCELSIKSDIRDLLQIDPELLLKFNHSVPRYTSYPTAPEFYPVEPSFFKERLDQYANSADPLSIYVHIPFCKSMCLYCGCSVILNRRSDVQQNYVDLLCKEIELLPFKKRKVVTQLHFGGGTPTSLTFHQMEQILNSLRKRFDLVDEIAIEVDPRSGLDKLDELKLHGFNRLSFGVQDLDLSVQEAVRRRQDESLSIQMVKKAQNLGFKGINVDLIYGLPNQSATSFKQTAEKIALLSPDRISFFSYAKVPWLKPHQKSIKEDTLPSDLEKFHIYSIARKIWMDAGYQSIGMDHFAKPSDPLFHEPRQRNFQGYTVKKAENLLGLGVTSIGMIQGAYLQNVKNLEEYSSRILSSTTPIYRGFLLSEEDVKRKWVIQELMCNFRVDKQVFEREFNISFDHIFKERNEIPEELYLETNDCIEATPLGKIFIRVLASRFDAYYQQKQNIYSRAL